jgi:hypothetical protein
MSEPTGQPCERVLDEVLDGFEIAGQEVREPQSRRGVLNVELFES